MFRWASTWRDTIPASVFTTGPFTVGYLARVAPEKGLHLLAESYLRLRRETDFGGAALEAAGYLAPEHRGYLRGIERRMKDAGLAHEFRYRGALDRPRKIEFLRNLDVLSVPATYDEPKGISLLEAMACGVPVVAAAARSIPRDPGENGRRNPGGTRRPGESGGRYLPAVEGPRAARGARAAGRARGPRALQRGAHGRAGGRGIREHRRGARFMLESPASPRSTRRRAGR